MGIEINYRTSTLKKEIIDSLINIHIESSPVLIWQNESGKRKVTKAKIEAIDFSSDSIFLTPFSEIEKNEFQNFDSRNTIYLRGNNQSIVFKQDKIAIKSSNGLLQIVIPEEVKMFEKRGEVRLQSLDQILKLTTHFYLANNDTRTAKPIVGELRDVSLSGMGFFIEKKHAHLFSEKDKLKIERIGNFRFPRAIYGEIVYARIDHETVNKIRIGVRFNEKLNPDILVLVN